MSGACAVSHVVPVSRGIVTESRRFESPDRPSALGIVEQLLGEGLAVRMTENAGKFVVVGLVIAYV